MSTSAVVVGERNGPMLRSAEISDDGLYRYRLTRAWGDTQRFLRFVMLNPSTADALVDDPTIRRCIGFARDLGYDGLVVLNLYAFRATKPADLWKADEPTGGPRNDLALRNTLMQASALNEPVVAAWGAHARPDRVAWLTSLPGAEQLHALAVTKAGAPGHPLYLPAAARPEPWPVAS